MVGFVMDEMLKRTIIYSQGYKIEMLDFGYWEREYHHREVYVEDIRPGVVIGSKKYTVDEAVEYILGEASKRLLLRELNIN